MKVNDLVTRKKYGNDVIFRIISIQNDRVLLKGEVVRLVADAPLEDLTIFNAEKKQMVSLPYIKNEKSIIKGKILHLDGDKYYLNKAMDSYKKYELDAVGYYITETELPNKIKDFILMHKPDILVITGHDSLKTNEDKFNLDSYRNSKYFIQAVKIARSINSNKDDLIIIAGACQSYYEALIDSGANFASSPSRSNIHLLDPVIIASFIANCRINEIIDIEYILSNTISKSLGGIETKGKARKVFVGGV